MTANTETERAEFEDGAWYWVEKEGWHGDPPTIAPAIYRANCDSWYSHGFGGIPTRFLKVLEPCTRVEQAARRAPAVPEKESLHECAMCDLSYAQGLLAGWNFCVDDDDEGLQKARSQRIEAGVQTLKALAAAPQPPEGGANAN